MVSMGERFQGGEGIKAYIIRLGCVFTIFGKEISVAEDFIQFPKCPLHPTYSFHHSFQIYFFSLHIVQHFHASSQALPATEEHSNKPFLRQLIDLFKPSSLYQRLAFISFFLTFFFRLNCLPVILTQCHILTLQL